MTSISNLLNSLYPFTGSDSGGASSPISTLAEALDSIGNTNTSGGYSQDAYTLNLSPEAQRYLNGASDNFLLSAGQKQAISSIIAQYKDAPFTQGTFVQIQKDLAGAGLGVQQLSLKDKLQNFSPTTVLLEALNDTAADSEAATASLDTASQNKANNYLKSIVSEWQSISTTISAGSAT